MTVAAVTFDILMQTHAGLHTNCPEPPKLVYDPGGLPSKGGPVKNLYLLSVAE